MAPGIKTTNRARLSGKVKKQENIGILHDLVRDRIQRSLDAKQKLLDDCSLQDLILRVALRIVDSLRSGGKVLFFGNGGSAADAQHSDLILPSSANLRPLANRVTSL